MPTIRIPQLHTWIEYPDRKEGLVRVRSFIPIPKTPSTQNPSPTDSLSSGLIDEILHKRTLHRFPLHDENQRPVIPMELRFQRMPFFRRLTSAASSDNPESDDLANLIEADAQDLRKILTNKGFKDLNERQFSVLRRAVGYLPRTSGINEPLSFLDGCAEAISGEIHSAARSQGGQSNINLVDRSESRFRWSIQVLRFKFAQVNFQLSIPLEFLKFLYNEFGEEDLNDFEKEVRHNLFPAIFIDWALLGIPRGRKSKASYLLKTAKIALYMAHGLVAKAQTSQQLQNRIMDVLGRDKPWSGYLGKISENDDGSYGNRRNLVLILVTRTLHPAWDKYKVMQFALRNPTEVYREFLNKHSRKSLRSYRLSISARRPDFVDSWFERLLGDEGQTAHDFDLL